MEPLYLGIFDNRESVAREFNVNLSDDIEILAAVYEYENYEGAAFVLFRQNGVLYEVNGGHCSCYGLSEYSYVGGTESQWEPEEVEIRELVKRPVFISFWGSGQWDDWNKDIRSLIKSLPEADNIEVVNG